jgi:hypothetical protein
MVQAVDLVRQVLRHAGAVWDAMTVRNARVRTSLLGPVVRGVLLQRGKGRTSATIPAAYDAYFTYQYQADNRALRRLYRQAKRDQWDGERALDWDIDVDPLNPAVPLLADAMLPLQDCPGFRTLPATRKAEQVRGLTAWLLSQILHGEQGALCAACQITESIHWMDGKLYGATQVEDEGRHVEVFGRYLLEKLNKLYAINDNLYVLIDAVMTDRRWDLKCLGMQILSEGLALAAFGTLRQSTAEPLLKELLRFVITDEARHVHFGVVALKDYYTRHLRASERREREDWAFEMVLLMRNRFLAHEFYDEYWGHAMRRRHWDALLLQSAFMRTFQAAMSRRIIPNLKRIGLLSERIRPHYNALGLLAFEYTPAAPELTIDDLLHG